MMSRTCWMICSLLMAFACPPSSWAQTGVSDDRVSLPDGPGSVEGLGDSASIDPNMGMMHYEVPIEVPRGFPGVTPQLALVYGSGSGSSTVGIGWTLHAPSIERLTLRGLPRYDADDEIAADGGEQLVRVSRSGSKAVYRARFERGFVRYTWHVAGAEGYFTAEYPDGRIGYFGADAAGRVVPEARTSHAGHTFRYHLVEVVDVFGHRLHYGYTLVAGVPLLTGVDYVHDAQGRATYRVELSYEDRPDHLSDAKPGWDERLTRRLAGIAVTARGERIRRYALSYEREEVARGLSRLSRVQSFGRDDTAYPVVFSFGYSRTLGGVCTTAQCERPFVVDMGSLASGIQIGTGDATLVDLNGDSLPDLVDASEAGAHRVFFNTLGDDGQAHFAPAARLSALATRSAFPLSASYVQVFDVNGDGFSDLTNSLTKRVLCNNGSGDWVSDGCRLGDGIGIALEPDTSTPGDPNPLGVRFLDVDNDRRVDLLSTPDIATALVRRNTGSGFEELRGEPLGKEFDRDRLLLADMNGDGLLDPVEVDGQGVVSYRLHLGRARWSPTWTTVPGPSIDLSDLDKVALEDLNADGLDDLVIVGAEVRYALNRNGLRFDAFETVSTEDLGSGEALPVASEFTTVVYADMNGNGSRDIVWIESSGRVRYLELFPVRPNLLSRIENGLGSVQEVHYTTAVEQRHGDDTPWAYPFAQAMNVVARLDTWVTLTGGENGEGLHELTAYRYRDGYYDGDEKQFRGFARVELREVADADDAHQEGGRSVLRYDVGHDDPYLAGRLLSLESFTGEGAAQRPVQAESTRYGDCTVSGVPKTGLLFAVRFVCAQERTIVRQEGSTEDAWATVQTRSEYDGYGNVTRNAELGVVHRGGPGAPLACGVCARDSDAFGTPCGNGCLGDERFVETEYVDPERSTGGRWILHKPYTVRLYGQKGGMTREVSTYYDGPAFVGLARGQLTKGNVTRVSERIAQGSTETIDRERHEYDAHGNAVVTIDPNGTVAEDTNHRRSYQYDATGLHIVRSEVHVVSPEGEAYRLRREYGYDLAFDKIAAATDWMLLRGGELRTSRNESTYRYDEFGRRIAIALPGDTADAPSLEFEWKLADPVSSIVTRGRSRRGEASDIERVQCLDGRGGRVQERVRVGEADYHVSGFNMLNSRGLAVRSYQPHRAPSATCAPSAPVDVLFEDLRYDSAGRPLLRTLPDGARHGTASTRRLVHGPLHRLEYDEEDLDPVSTHHDTPTRIEMDGLGRVVRIERTLRAGDAGAITRIEYDGLGQIRTVIDPLGQRKEQRYDLLGRLNELEDPSSGHVRFAHDAAGNRIAVTDARGVVVRREFDGVNRPIAQWDEADPDGTAQRLRYDFAADCDPAECTHGAGRLVEAAYPLPDLSGRQGARGDRGVDHAGYDARGQRVLETRTLFGVPYRTSYEYDNAGRATLVEHPDGTRISRRFDGAARLIGVEGVVDEVRYDDRGLASALTFNNGATDSWELDERMRLVRRLTRARDGSALQDVTYTRDRVGNLLHLSDTAGQPDGWSALDASFDYDAWYRVRAASYVRGNETEQLAWQFDELDRVLSATSSGGEESAGHVGAYTYDPARQSAVTAAGSLVMSYDDAGNLKQRGDVAYAWDFLGRLANVQREGEPSVELVHGSGTSPVAIIEGAAITLHVSPDFEVRDGVGVTYVRVGGQRVARLESDARTAAWLGDPAPWKAPDGVVTAGDGWVAHAEQTGLLAAGPHAAAPARSYLRAAARRLLLEAGGSFSTLHADHLGNLVLAVDAGGRETGRRRYRVPGGEERASAFVDVYGLTGQEEVASVGLVRFEHRWLDPLTQRWAQPDPAFQVAKEVKPELAGELSDAYAYVGNRFPNYVDPTGLTKEGAQAALKTAVHRVVARNRAALRVLALGDAAHAHGDGGGYENMVRDLVFAELHDMATRGEQVQGPHGMETVRNVAREQRRFHHPATGAQTAERADIVITMADHADLVIEAKAESARRDADTFAGLVRDDAAKLTRAAVAPGGGTAQLLLLRPLTHTDLAWSPGAHLAQGHMQLIEEVSHDGNFAMPDLGVYAVWY